MKTLMLTEDDEKAIELACEILKRGDVVAVPTETVYGLAGDCTNPKAIKKIFKAKGRPADNPLIVHIASLEMLDGIVASFSKDATKLAHAFWPGPLTIILPKGEKVCKESCGGLDTVGIRMPANPTAREIIKRSGIPFSAPSANLSGKPSPTTAEEVFEDMNGRIPLIVDGGKCDTGVESTVLSLANGVPVILRPGYITKEDIEKVLDKKVRIAKAVTSPLKEGETVLSPGMKYKHYAPKANVILVKSSLKKFANYLKDMDKETTFAVCFDGEQDKLPIKSLTYGKIDDEKEQAHEIFSVLRELDKVGAETVYVRCPKTKGVALAVYNRLIRSAGFQIITL